MIIYRYLLSQYLKVLFFCCASLLAILITTRLHQIAKIASFGASGWSLLQFALYQIPYILPLVIPIACLISAILITQRLSSQNEITTLRASGLSFRSIFSPLLFGGVALALLNFYIISEVSTSARLHLKLITNELSSIDPIALLRSKHLQSLKNFYGQAKSAPLRNDVEDVQIAFWDRNSEQIRLLLASKASPTKDGVEVSEMALLSPLSDKKGFAFETASKVQLSSKDLSLFMKQRAWEVKPEFLPLKWLLASDPMRPRQISELFRRISLSFAAFSFTLMGIAFGMALGRERSQKGIISAVCLSAIFLVCFFLAKQNSDTLLYSTLLYSLPQLLIVTLSLKTLSSLSLGEHS